MLRPEEEFVADRLLKYLSEFEKVQYNAGGDPPDLIFNLNEKTVSVEVSCLLQPVLGAPFAGRNRRTYDEAAAHFVDILDRQLGPLLPSNLSVLIVIEMPANNLAKFKKEAKKWVEDALSDDLDFGKKKTKIQGVSLSLSIIPLRTSGKKIVGIISNRCSSPDISLNASIALSERISQKNRICSPDSVPKPVWLALLNQYWLADLETYKSVAKDVSLDHCFERMFVVSLDGNVCEL